MSAQNNSQNMNINEEQPEQQEQQQPEQQEQPEQQQEQQQDEQQEEQEEEQEEQEEQQQQQVEKKKMAEPSIMMGSIEEASRVLDWIMDPDCGSVDPALFGPDLKGIAFLTSGQAAFVFAGNAGTGIVMKHNVDDGSWSAPSAIGVTGVGFGFMAGASMRHLVYLIYDDMTMNAMTGSRGVTLGTKLEAAGPKRGRSAELTDVFTNKGVGSDICLHFSKGVFGGLSAETAVCGSRNAMNEKFYGKKVTPTDILCDNNVEMPEGTKIQEVYDKLNTLCYDWALLRYENYREQERENAVKKVENETAKVEKKADDNQQPNDQEGAKKDEEEPAQENLDAKNEDKKYVRVERDINFRKFPIRQRNEVVVE